MQIVINETVIEIRQADITGMATDAIVNAANELLAHGGGVAGAIARKGGAAIQQESSEWVRLHGPVLTGTAAITGAGLLAARYVIHAVGPIMGSGDEDRKLQAATQAALDLADAYGLHSISFPAISTGIFGYPVDRCARIMLSTAATHAQTDTRLHHIVFCLLDARTFGEFGKMLQTIKIP